VTSTSTVINLAQNFGTTGLRDWISNNIVSVVLLLVAAGLIALASKGDMSKVMTTVAIVVVGLAIAGLAVGGDYVAISQWVIGLLRQG